MEFDGKKFDVPQQYYEDFFACMDRFEKVVLSSDTKPKTITKEDEETYCLYSVAGHVIGLPKEAKEALKPFIVYKK